MGRILKLKKTVTTRRVKRKPVDAGSPVKIALSPSVFATVSEVDWGHVYYMGEWKLIGKEAKLGKLRLPEIIAQRMGLDCTIPIAFKDGDPLNCTRANLFTTIYVWMKATISVQMFDDDKPYHEERPGYTYGNVGIWCQNTWWVMTHLPTGQSTGASWPTFKTARAGIEAIHAERNLKELDRVDKMKAIDFKRWRAVINKYKG